MFLFTFFFISMRFVSLSHFILEAILIDAQSYDFTLRHIPTWLSTSSPYDTVIKKDI